MQEDWRMLITAKVNMNGCVTLPAEIRKEKNLNPGDQIIWFKDERTAQIFLVSQDEYLEFLERIDEKQLRKHHLGALGLKEKNVTSITNLAPRKKI